MDRKTRKLMFMRSALHPWANVDKLCVTRGEKGDWMSVEDVVRVEQHSLSNYVKKAEVNLDRVMDAFAKEKRNRKIICEQQKRKQDEWRDKPLHRQCPSRTDEKGVSC